MEIFQKTNPEKKKKKIIEKRENMRHINVGILNDFSHEKRQQKKSANMKHGRADLEQKIIDFLVLFKFANKFKRVYIFKMGVKI